MEEFVKLFVLLEANGGGETVTQMDTELLQHSFKGQGRELNFFRVPSKSIQCLQTLSHLFHKMDFEVHQSILAQAVCLGFLSC